MPHGEKADPTPRRPGYYLFVGEGQADDAIRLIDLWEILWSRRWLVIGITGVFAITSIVISLLLTPVYRADAVLAPATTDDMRGVAGQLGGLASLAGIRLGGMTNESTGLAVLRSRAFAESFIRDHDLMPLLLEDSDSPTMYDALEVFREDVFSIQEDLVTGLVTVVVEWRDPEMAAAWVNDIIQRINVQMRTRDLAEAEKNLAYLREQLTQSSVVELQQAISRLIETEMQTAMVARAREEYAFTVIDTAIVPMRRSRPHRTLIVLVSTAAGAILSILAAILWHSFLQQRAARNAQPRSGLG